MEYTIVINYESVELIKRVNELIRLGWKPLGGLTTSVYRGQADDESDKENVYFYFGQAMVRELQ